MQNIIQEAKDFGKLIPFKNAFGNLPGWAEFEDIFSRAIETSRMTAYTFGTAGIDHAEELMPELTLIAKKIEDVHPGKFVSALAIIHFLNANNNDIPEDATTFYSTFRQNCQENVPPNFENLMSPTRHSDPIDGIYVQFVGQTLWKAYYDGFEESFILKPGDMIMIPKDIDHTVESLEPRIGVSFGLVD